MRKSFFGRFFFCINSSVGQVVGPLLGVAQRSDNATRSIWFDSRPLDYLKTKEK